MYSLQGKDGRDLFVQFSGCSFTGEQGIVPASSPHPHGPIRRCAVGVFRMKRGFVFWQVWNIAWSIILAWVVFCLWFLLRRW